MEIPTSADFSVLTSGAITVSAWIRPETLVFPNIEGTGYVHWLGKGEKGQHEWTFRMYSQGNTENRGNRISFYVFNPQGHKGVGSHFEDSLLAGEWIHVVGAADDQHTYIYRDGTLRDSDLYAGVITLQVGSAPLRVGPRDLNSFFQGEIREVRVWNRLLTDAEIASLYTSDVVPLSGLVAEYLLTQDIAPDSAQGHSGIIHAPVWISQAGQ